MKKIINSGLLIAFVAILASCAARTQTAATSQVSRSDVSGTWVVNNVSLENFPTGTQLGNVFDMYPYQDFQGSTWVLQGNGNGSVTLTNGAVQPIYWSVNKDMGFNTFEFKKIADGQRPRDVTTGYTLEFGDWTTENSVIKSPVMLSSGQKAYINFNLTKQ